MITTSKSVETAIEALTGLPTIGRKTAQRLALHLLRQPEEQVEKLANALLTMRKNIKYCSVCYNLTEDDPCSICTSTKRDKSIICVVEEPNDLFAIERTHDFFGLYHVLHGAINPLEGVTPADIKIKELLERLASGEVREIILALNPNVEGEVTTQYLIKLLKPLEINVTRIARGIPVGTDIEFSDDATIARALQGRIVL